MSKYSLSTPDRKIIVLKMVPSWNEGGLSLTMQKRFLIVLLITYLFSIRAWLGCFQIHTSCLLWILVSLFISGLSGLDFELGLVMVYSCLEKDNQCTSEKDRVDSSEAAKKGKWRPKVTLTEVVKNDMSIKKVTKSTLDRIECWKRIHMADLD